MKTKVVVGSLLPIIIGMMTFGAMAQRVENDDMYFNSKDREKLKSEKLDVANSGKSVNDKIDSDYNTFRKKHFDKDEPETEVAKDATNPTDSYSARTVNPEYIARSNAEQASEDENYYIEGYTPPNVYDSYSASSYDNTGYNNYYNNGYNSNYGYGGYSSMYNPYYSCNPWMSPYNYNSYAPGLTLSMAYMWGSPWNSGWNYGMSYGWGNSYYNPYAYYPSYYSPYYYGNGYGYPTYYYGNDSSQPNYGKRPSRHSAIVAPTPRSSERVSANTTTSGSTGGRTRQIVDEYYVKPYKRTTTSDSFINSSTESSRYSRPTSSDYPATRTRDSNSSPTRDSRSSYSSPTRTSSPQISMPSRSSGSSSGGSSGGSSPAPRKRN